MISPCCPICESFRTLSTLAARRRVICTECGARWVERAEETTAVDAEGVAETSIELAGSMAPISPNHPSALGQISLK